MARLFDDAQNEYLKISQAAVTAVPLTIACWAYIDDDTINNLLMAVSDDNGWNGFLLFAAAADTCSFYTMGGGGTSIASSADTYSTNTWHHFCGVTSGTASRYAYLDGVPGNEETTDRTPGGIDNTTIGCGYYGSAIQYPTSGRIAEGAIWNVALTTAEIEILAEGYSPLFVRPQNLVAYWPLIRDEDQDRVGGYDMTAYNAPGIVAHPPVIYPAPPYIIAVAPPPPITIPRHPAVIFQCPAIV